MTNTHPTEYAFVTFEYALSAARTVEVWFHHPMGEGFVVKTTKASVRDSGLAEALGGTRATPPQPGWTLTHDDDDGRHLWAYCPDTETLSIG